MWKISGGRKTKGISSTFSMKTWKRSERSQAHVTCRAGHITKACDILLKNAAPHHRILVGKWSASWGTWTCCSLMRSSTKLWSSHLSRWWRRTPWPTTPASLILFLIAPSPTSWEKVIKLFFRSHPDGLGVQTVPCHAKFTAPMFSSDNIWERSSLYFFFSLLC